MQQKERNDSGRVSLHSKGKVHLIWQGGDEDVEGGSENI